LPTACSLMKVAVKTFTWVIFTLIERDEYSVSE
jgi:hypothetical protein